MTSMTERPVAALAASELLVERVGAAADRVISIDLAAPDGGVLPPWTPGAHLTVHLPSGLRRQYSLCGSPRDAGSYRIAVLDDPAGRGGSRELHRIAAAGARLVVSGPDNDFPLRPARDHRFVAGGIGITPILPMVHAADAAGAAWSLLYGGRTRRSMAFLDELPAHAGPRLRVVEQDRHGLPDLAGFLAGAGPDTAVHCCGPAGLIEATRAVCAAAGLADRLHLERFGPAARVEPVEPVVPQQERPIEVELRRSGTRVTVQPACSILRAVRTVLPDHPSSCEDGYCGTCEARVLDGVPEHRDTVLSEDERAAGDCMMICVSRARTATLALDL